VPVDPSSCSYDAQPVIIVGPTRWNNGADSAVSQSLTADGARGSYSITVADARNFKAGTFVLLDEVSGASWQPTPPGFPGGAKVWQGDRVAWNIHYPGPDGKFGKTDAKLVDPQSNAVGSLTVALS